MAAGDAQRAWFPEMMAKLKEAWDPQMSWEELYGLTYQMRRAAVSVLAQPGFISA
jgi:hypothetical protein